MKRLILSAAALALLSGTAFAADVIVVPPPPAPAPIPVPIVVNDPPSRLYITAFGGLLWVQDVDVAAGEPETTPDLFAVGTDRGYRVGGALGLQFTPMLGAELEVAFGHVALDTLLIPGDDPVDITGAGANGRLLTVMGNLTIGQQFGALRPYVAVGAGAARVGLSIPDDTIGPDGVDGTDWTWAVQAMAGVDYAITDNISIGARYRFQHVGPTDFLDNGGTPVNLDGFNNHGLEGVLTVRF